MIKMDPQKESTLLKYINILGGHDVTKLIHLKSGHFYLYLLNILDYSCNSECKSDEDRLHLVKEFLNDYFCDSAKLNQTICFDKILNASDFFENPKDIDVELAKVVVLLIAIGAFGDSHEHFISSAVQLPSEMHLDIMAIIQSAIPMDSSQVVLSPQIEQTLRGVTGTKKIYLSVEDTKLKNGKAPMMKNTVPTMRGSSTYEETLPVTLCTQEKSVSSKDLEIRALRQQLNNEICLKEELQFLLQDYKSEIILKDSEIISLRKKLKEVIHMQNSYEDLQEMKQKYNQLELNLDRLNKTVLTLHHYKDYSHVLEKENLSLNDEISKLEKEVKNMQLEINKARDLMKIIDKLESQVKALESQTENMYKFKQECEEVKVSLREALEVNEMLLQEIHQLKDQDKEKELEETMDSFIELQVVELKQQLEEVICERDALREELSAFKAKPCGMLGSLQLHQLSASTEIDNKEQEFKINEKYEGPFNCGIVELLTEMNTELEKELDKIKYSVMKINELSPIGKWQCPEIKQNNQTPVLNYSKRKYLNFLEDVVVLEEPNLKNVDEEMSRSMFNLHLEFISLKRIVEESLFKNYDLQLQFFKSLQKQNNIAEVKNNVLNPDLDLMALQSTLLEKKQENSDVIYLFSLLEELKIGSRLSNILRHLEFSMKDKVLLEEKDFSDIPPVGVVDTDKLFSMLKEIDNICTQLESKALLFSEMREEEGVVSEKATQTEEHLSLYKKTVTELVGTDQTNLAHLTQSDPQTAADVLNDKVFTSQSGHGMRTDNVSHKSQQVSDQASVATRQPLAKYSDAGKNIKSSKRKMKQVSFTFPSIKQFSYIHPKRVYSFLTYVPLSDTRQVKKFRRFKHKIVPKQESDCKSQPGGLLQENHLKSVKENKAIEITSELNLTEWNTINVDERDVEYHHRNNTTTATSHQENLAHTDLIESDKLAPKLSPPISQGSAIKKFFSSKKKKDASPILEHAAPLYDYDDLFFPWPSLLFYFLGGW